MTISWFRCKRLACETWTDLKEAVDILVLLGELPSTLGETIHVER